MNRIIILRIAGIGVGTNQTAFSSRPLAYAASNVVCVVSATDAFTSELTPFSSRGSSPSMTVSALYNSDSGPLLLSRVMTPVYTSTGNPVTTTGYVPAARPATIGVTDVAPFSVNDIISLGCEAVRVTAKGASTITVTSTRGSAPVPHPYLADGPAPGVTVFEKVPGIEGLRCTVSWCYDDNVSEALETVVFRGVVGSAEIDTSAGGDLRINLTLQSIVGSVDSSPWIPRQYAWLRGRMSPPAAGALESWCYLTGNVAASAPRSSAGTAADVPLRFLYLIAGDSWLTYEVTAYTSTSRASTATLSQSGETRRPVAFGRGRAFSGGPSRNFNVAPDYDSAVGQDFASAMSDPAGYRSLVWQEVVCAPSPGLLLKQILTGIDAATGTLETSWATAAWVDVDAIDLNTVARLSDAVAAQAVTFTDSNNVQWYALPPRLGGSDKGLLAWLIETIFEPAAIALIVQAGKIRLVSWGTREEWPATLTSSVLASPSAAIAFGRNGIVQAVKVKALGVNSYAFNVSSPEVVYVNRAAATEGGGQTVSLTTANATVMTFGQGDALGAAFVPGDATVELAELLVARYSRSCPMLTVTVRDSAQTYTVGDQVLVTLATVPAADGTMGLSQCRGVVLRANTKWMQGVTVYGVILIGYADAIGRPPMWASSGTVVSDSGSVLTIAANDYTRAPIDAGATPWPQSDAAAWEQTLALLGAGVRLALLDQYGAPYTVTTAPFLDSVDVGANQLTYTGSWAPATPAAGDVVVLAPAPIQATPEASFDAFLSGTDGQVEGPVGPFDGWRFLP